MEADEKDELHTPYKVGGARTGLRPQANDQTLDKVSNHSSPCVVREKNQGLDLAKLKGADSNIATA